MKRREKKGRYLFLIRYDIFFINIENPTLPSPSPYFEKNRPQKGGERNQAKIKI